MRDNYRAAAATHEGVQELRLFLASNKAARLYADMGLTSLALSTRGIGELHRQRAITLFHKAAHAVDGQKALELYPTITQES